jgi:hypothetical protein
LIAPDKMKINGQNNWLALRNKRLLCWTTFLFGLNYGELWPAKLLHANENY